MATSRKAEIIRQTKETQIKVELSLDGNGKGSISTGIPFFDHMLDLFSRHGFFDLSIQATGDIEIDYHHLVEDMGICVGQAFKKALSDKAKDWNKVKIRAVGPNYTKIYHGRMTDDQHSWSRGANTIHKCCENEKYHTNRTELIVGSINDIC